MNASPSTKIFFRLIPAGKAKISTTDRKTIKSNGNLPIPHSEKAKAKRCDLHIDFIVQTNLYEILNLEYWLSKSYCESLELMHLIITRTTVSRQISSLIYAELSRGFLVDVQSYSNYSRNFVIHTSVRFYEITIALGNHFLRSSPICNSWA